MALQTAAHDGPVLFLALELSKSAWLLAAHLPGADKPKLHRIEAGDTAALLATIAALRARVAGGSGAAVDVACCFEAGRDGFWLHRLLTANGVASHVLEPTSILVNRRARRAKTDRLDAQGLLRVLMAHCRGDRQACSMVRVPTPEEEDAKRLHREREHPVRERVRVENRIGALLATQGIRGRPSLRSWERDMTALRTGDGRALPTRLRAELDRLRRRLVLTLEMIREVEAERAAALAAEPQDDTCRTIAALCRIRGIGETSATVLAREVLYRPFANRKQLASYVGLAPMPYQSGGMDRDRRISRSGNPRADGHHPARLASAALPARQRARRLVPRARRRPGRADPADRHRGHGAQAADRALEIRPDRAAARGGRDRGVEEIAVGGMPVGGGAGSTTVFVIGSAQPPRFRWVVFCRGHASRMRHSGAGPATDPTACKVVRPTAAAKQDGPGPGPRIKRPATRDKDKQVQSTA
jgi:transposase